MLDQSSFLLIQFGKLQFELRINILLNLIFSSLFATCLLFGLFLLNLRKILRNKFVVLLLFLLNFLSCQWRSCSFLLHALHLLLHLLLLLSYLFVNSFFSILNIFNAVFKLNSNIVFLLARLFHNFVIEFEQTHGLSHKMSFFGNLS